MNTIADKLRKDLQLLLRILHSESGVNTLIGLQGVELAGGKVLVKEYQLDPIDHKLLHADFYAVAMDKSIVVTVPIVIMVLLFQRRIVAGLTAGAVKG